MGALFLHVLKTALTFLLAQEVQGAQIYVGCYKEILEYFIINSVQNASQCMTECRQHLSVFAAIKDGLFCYCAKQIRARVSLSNCNVSCVDNDGICGGSQFYAVYTGVPAYYGCFKDDIINRDMNLVLTGDWSMTIDKCYYRCSKRNYIFMGLQSGGSCFCDNQYGKYGRVPESECNVTCTKNGNQMCGGHARNSVYSVNYLPGLNKSYSEMFHCLKDKPDRSGTCPLSACQAGWKGTKCNHRDCLTNNGNCGEQKCVEIKISNQELSECVCKEGFRYNYVKEECLDVDECFASVCNESTSICKNTVGSYDCICNEGFAKDSSTKECKDLDECSFKVCDDLTSTCVNTFGSYHCLCKEGFLINSTSNVCEDQNECLLNVCKDSYTTCINTVGSYQCTCNKGFLQNSSSHNCDDIDECTSNPCNLLTSICKNSVGSYDCICREGFQRISSSNSDCADIDECTSNPCNMSTSICKNSVGSYDCICREGFQRISSSNSDCTDLDECTSKPCNMSTSICKNSFGSYDCICREGFQRISSSNSDCTDIDECTSNPCNMSTSICKNSVGSYDCICREGFQRISSSNSDCTDLDECQNNPCNKPSEICKNTVGSFMCTCSPGYDYAKQSNCIGCSGLLFECYNSTFCQPMQGYKCDSVEMRYKYDGHISGIKNKKIILVFTTFLGVLICALLIYAVQRFLSRKGFY